MSTTSTFEMISTKMITPDPHQPRRIFDQEPLDELCESIKTYGIIQPILVRVSKTAKTPYMLVSGERRFRAATMAGLTDIPAIIRDLTDDQAREIQIIENLQRRDVHPIEEANAFAQLRSTYTADEIALRVGKSTAYVHNRIKLTTLCEKAQALFYEDRMTLKQAHLLSVLPDASQSQVIDISVSRQNTSNSKWTIGSIDYLVEQKISEFDMSLFNPLDANLIPSAGSCQSCPYNSALSPTLFDENRNPSCSNNACFSTKVIKALERDIINAADTAQAISISSYFNEDDYKDILNTLLSKHTTLPVYDKYKVTCIDKPDDILPMSEYFLEEYMGSDETMDGEDFLQDYEQYKEKLIQDREAYTLEIYNAIPILEISSRLSRHMVYATSLPVNAQPNKPATIQGDKIADLRSKEQRATELDDEKLYTKIAGSLLNADSAWSIHKWIDEDAILFGDAKRAACIMIYSQISYSTKRAYCIEHFGKPHPDDTDVIEHFMTDKGSFNIMIRLFISDNIPTSGTGRSLVHKAAMILARELHPSMVLDHTRDIEDAATKRRANLEKKITELS